jgi:rubredoxin
MVEADSAILGQGRRNTRRGSRQSQWHAISAADLERKGIQHSTVKRYICLYCGFIYDEALGLPDAGVAPGTTWADIPEDWECPDCGNPKSAFVMQEI